MSAEEAIEARRYAWPEVELDPVARMRALTAGRPYVAAREGLFNVDFESFWSFIADLEQNTARYEIPVSNLRIVAREPESDSSQPGPLGERIRLETRSPLGLRIDFEAVLRPGWCLMQSRFGEIGMAARPEGQGQTRFFHFEGSKAAGRLARPFFRWNIAHDFRRLRTLLE